MSTIRPMPVLTHIKKLDAHLTGPLSSGVRIRRRVEASEDSRLSIHAHPVFRSVGRASVANAHQTPIWIKSGRIAPARERPLVGWSVPLKELALQMRCSRCGKKAAEVVAAAKPRPRKR